MPIEPQLTGGTPGNSTLESIAQFVSELRELTFRDILTLFRREVRGTATFAGAGTIAVTFASSLLTTEYMVTLEPSVNETFWVTLITATGFTLNSSNAASTASVGWKASLD